MKIRSMTCFVNVDETLDGDALHNAGALAGLARARVPQAGYDLTSTRLAIQPLDRLVKTIPALDLATALDARLHNLGFDYGALMFETNSSWAQIPAIISSTESLFASLRIASRPEGINLRAIRAAAHVIHELAHATEDGFGNFRFTAAANCPPGIPFFPAAYAADGAYAFAFATEAADLAVDAFAGAQNLEDARVRFVQALEQNGARLGILGAELEQKTGLHFAGIDFSPAPYPEQARSLGEALERLTGARFGEHGTLFAASFVTDCLRQANYPRAGFGGLMIPVMEDWTLATRSLENLYTLDSLLLYSTVCGTGLDTVPLAGDTSEEAISALLLDLAALAVKLDKPLTARLIPVPGVQVGEATRFAFEYFANARAFEVRAGGLLKVFKKD